MKKMTPPTYLCNHWQSDRHGRFDKNILTNSYYSYIDNLSNAFLGGIKGYVLYFSITNLDSLIEKEGNQGYSFVLRNFTRELRDTTRQMSLFLYRDNILCFILPGFDRHMIMNSVKKSTRFSKRCKKSRRLYPFETSLYCPPFPQEYGNVTAFK